MFRIATNIMLYQSPSQDPGISLDQRLKLLYPMVNEEETPLPRAWSTKVVHTALSTIPFTNPARYILLLCDMIAPVNENKGQINIENYFISNKLCSFLLVGKQLISGVVCYLQLNLFIDRNVCFYMSSLRLFSSFSII